MPPPQPCSQLLTPERVAFLHSGLAAQVGTASADGVPALTRGAALRVAPDGRTVDVFVGKAQSTTCLANLRPGGLVAVSTGNPLDYKGIQFKGTVIDCRDTDGGDAEWIERYFALFEAKVAAIGIARPGNRSFRSQEYVRVTFVPTAVFSQSPGPGAGNPLDNDPSWS